jgi:hypothetical protein
MGLDAMKKLHREHIIKDKHDQKNVTNESN